MTDTIEVDARHYIFNNVLYDRNSFDDPAGYDAPRVLPPAVVAAVRERDNYRAYKSAYQESEAENERLRAEVSQLREIIEVAATEYSKVTHKHPVKPPEPVTPTGPVYVHVPHSSFSPCPGLTLVKPK